MNLQHLLKTKQMLDYPADFDEKDYPLFITWMKNGDLRGCIGTFQANKLGKTLQRYSLIAAVQDTRFDPISMDELPTLRAEVSLLTNFEEIQDPLDWEVGKHGIEIDFKDAAGRDYGGTFLPNVAPEQGWNQTETLEYLCRKAGYRGGFESVKDKFTKIKRY
mmetsp:Transcript_53085/g.72701  ORF Transcript_53085/g.72701 Transcript_53085/m.72701 type:complete len:162 (+) Transcript_53085:56-541(+)